MTLLRSGEMPKGFRPGTQIILHRIDGFREEVFASEIDQYYERVVSLHEFPGVFVRMGCRHVQIQSTFEEWLHVLNDKLWDGIAPPSQALPDKTSEAEKAVSHGA